MQWYFLSDTQEQVPVEEGHIAGLVQSGAIRSNTMIWKEGMPNWVACSEVKPELFALRPVVPVVGAAATARQAATATRPVGAPATAATGMHSAAATAGRQLADGQMVRETATAFASAAGWMKFLGVVFLICGVASILFALFLVVAASSADGGLIPGLMAGVVTAAIGGVLMWMGMLLFQSAAKAQEAAQTAQKHALLSALHQNARFFKIWGIATIVGWVVYGIMLFLFFSFFARMTGFNGATSDFDALDPGLETTNDDISAATTSDDDSDDTDASDNDTEASDSDDDTSSN